VRSEVGTFVDEEIFFNEAPETQTNEFSGDCYLLINRDSYSAASSFAATFQCYQMGTIVGEETGGTKIFRANPLGFELSKSNIPYRLSTVINYNTCYNAEMEGVKPDVEFSPSILDICSETDSQLLFVQHIIRKRQKMKAQSQGK